MDKSAKKLLVVEVAALGFDLLEQNDCRALNGLPFKPLESVFPAVTCSVQASFRTATAPAEHGVIANGMFSRELRKPLFWEQSARLVKGGRIWDDFRAAGNRVGLLFWQQSLGEAADILLSPAPIHKHHGGMIQSCYSQPHDLYELLCREVGESFNLMHYWGPRASVRGSEWITSATSALLRDSRNAPELCLTYLPGLDYDLQRHGPDSKQARVALTSVLEQLDRLLEVASEEGYESVVFGDYAIAPLKPEGAIFPNRALLEAGHFKTRSVAGRQYPDLYTSPAFAMVDHEVAHIFISDYADRDAIRSLLSGLPGVEAVMDLAEQKKAGVAHSNSGELVLLARDGYWFAYPWWQDRRQSPDYASHVDIHNKPGYDPCELFFGWPPPSISSNTARIRGSHGRIGAGRQAAWLATEGFTAEADNLLDLAREVRGYISEGSR